MAETPHYTKAELLTEIRTTINESAELTVSDTEINAWIDRGARKLSQIALCVPDKDTITTVASMYGYTLAIPLIKVRSVIYNNVGLRRVKSIREFGRGVRANPGTAPQAYYHFGNCLYLYPSPAVSLTVYVYGWRSATGYADSSDDSPDKYEIPNALQPLVMDYALACIYTKRGVHQLSWFHMVKFLNEAVAWRRSVLDKSLRVDSIDSTKQPDRAVILQ